MASELGKTTLDTAPLAEESEALDRGEDRYTYIFYGLVAGALIMGVARRILAGWDAPLWLDETFTGAIAIGPTFRQLLQDCLNEPGGPDYYSLMWVWAKLFGASNAALRTPSFIFAIATPLVILWKGHPKSHVRLTWAAIAALWIPGFYYATEARPYALIFLLASIQVSLFARLLTDASRGHAYSWAAISSLLVLTHTVAALQTAIEGLMFVIVHRRAALRHWPAALLRCRALRGRSALSTALA